MNADNVLQKELTQQEQFLDRIKQLCDGENGRPDNLVELAERVDIAKHSIYKWNVQKPTYDKVFEVAKVLETTVEYLIEG